MKPKHSFILRLFYFLFFLTIANTSVFAYSFFNGYYYRFSGSKEVEIDGSGNPTTNLGTYYGNLVIPSSVTYNGVSYTVTGISVAAFDGCSDLYRVTLPPTIKRIGNSAFRGCSLLTDILYSGKCNVTEIGDAVFEGCVSLQSFSIPSGVGKITGRTFDGCSALKTLYIEDSSTPLVFEPEGYWDEDYNLGKVLLKDCPIEYCYIGRNLNRISENYDTYVFPSSLSKIKVGPNVSYNKNNYADRSGYSQCFLKTNIKEAIFYGGVFADALSSKAEVYVPESYITETSPINWQGFKNIADSNTNKALLDKALEEGWMDIYDPYLTDLAVKNVTTIDFSGNKTLTTFDEFKYFTGITTISNRPFYNCSNLTSISLPNSLELISDAYAFLGCSKLESVTIDDGTQPIQLGISNSALKSMNLKQLYIGRGITNTPTPLVTTATNVKFGDEVTTVPANLFYNRKVQSLSLGNNIRIIEKDAFRDNLFTSVVIPDNVEVIGSGSFAGCHELATAVIGNSVTSIEGEAFRSCKLSNVSIPASVESIGNDAFCGMSSLSSISLCNGLKYIGEYAFQNAGTDHVIIPESVETVDYHAFTSCGHLKYAIFLNKDTKMGEDVFAYCSNMDKKTDVSITYYDGTNSLTTKSAMIFGTPVTKEMFDTCIDSYNPSCVLSVAITSEFIDNDFTLSHVYDYNVGENAIMYVPASYTENATNYVHTYNSENVIIKDMYPVYVPASFSANNLRFKRTFNNTNWQALYVPFVMSFEDWSDDFDLAEINNFHEYDDDSDGTIDRTELEILYVTSGDIQPNTPYLIRAKETGEKTITLTDATLYKTEVNSVDCSSVKTKYTFTGTYDGVSGEEMYNNGYYALAGGALKQAASSNVSLGAFRWYLKAEPRGTFGAAPRTNEINIRMVGFEDESTGIAEAETKTANAEFYTLNGTKVANADLPGVYVKKYSDGTTKKIIKK